MNKTAFGSEKVIIEHISETDLKTYLVGFDLTDSGESIYRWGNLTNILQKVIPEFAFGHHVGDKINLSDITSLLCDAAKSIYKIKEYEEVKKIYVDKNSNIADDDDENQFLKRGEFGELILHLLLRDFQQTIPLLSKIFFKDTYGATVHGFDAVHIQPQNKTLWLGESKLYLDGKKGIKALIQDIKEHFKRDYLNDEFTIISKKLKLFDNIPEKDYWLNLIDKNTKLDTIFSSIVIPLLCTYSCDLFNQYNNENDSQFIQYYENEMRNLKQYFDNENDHPLKTNLKIILLIFPVKCKNQLIKRLHKKLYQLQEIENE